MKVESNDGRIPNDGAAIVKSISIDARDIGIDGGERWLFVGDHGDGVDAVVDGMRGEVDHILRLGVIGIDGKEADLDRLVDG